MDNASMVDVSSTEQHQDVSRGGNASITSDVEMDDESQSPAKPRYSKNERVFAKDNEGNKQYFRATVKQVKLQKDVYRYKVHYSGWNDRFDEWVTDDKIMKDSEQNRRFLEVSKLLGGRSTKTNRETTVSNSDATKSKRKRDEDRGPGRKRRGGSNVLSVRSIYEDFCELPLTLKTVLVDEMEKVTRSQPYDCSSNSNPPAKSPARVVHQLPAPVTIQQVLKHFSKKRIQQINAANKSSAESKKEEVGQSSKFSASTLSTDVNMTTQDVEEFCSGLAELFETALPKFLLYPQERPQYEAMMLAMNKEEDNEDKKKDSLVSKRMTEIYGCEYLLRLYVRLPVLMQSESASNIKLVGPLLAELLILLQKNRQACFKGSYREPRHDEWLDVEKAIFQGGSNNKGAMDVCD